METTVTFLKYAILKSEMALHSGLGYSDEYVDLGTVDPSI